MKRIALIMFSLVILFSSVAFAKETGNVENLEGQEELVLDEDVQPRYAYIRLALVGLEIDENGHATYAGSTTVPGYNVRISLHLQRSKNELFWENIQGSMKRIYESGGMEKTADLPKDGYYYRAKLVVEVLDSNNNVIESENFYSSTEFY